MSSVTMVSRLLDAADLLIENGRLSGAFRRRAVSTAYYAVFHALAKTCANTLLSRKDIEDYTRVYRALDHGPLKNAFKEAPLRDQPNLREIGDLVILLQSKRHDADYLPPTDGIFSRATAKELVEQAREAVAKIEALDPKDRRKLAASLLFKKRQQ
jgi:uncharacterized protein (UPF0332 family)